MKLCARSFAIATSEVGSYNPRHDDEPDYEYDHVFCGLPDGHTGTHVAMIWFFDEGDAMRQIPEPEAKIPAVPGWGGQPPYRWTGPGYAFETTARAS